MSIDFNFLSFSRQMLFFLLFIYVHAGDLFIHPKMARLDKLLQSILPPMQPAVPVPHVPILPPMQPDVPIPINVPNVHNLVTQVRTRFNHALPPPPQAVVAVEEAVEEQVPTPDAPRATNGETDDRFNPFA